MSDIPAWGAALQTEVRNLQESLASHRKAFDAHTEQNRLTHKELYSRTERPSWTVAWVLTLMGGALGSLAVYALTH